MALRARLIVACIVVMSMPLAAYAQIDTEADAIKHGQADRLEIAAWFASLSGDTAAGAQFWAANRSLKHPPDCKATPPSSSPDWTYGCLAAQQKLAGPDVLRKTEPSYRLGWNSPSSSAPTQTPTPDQPSFEKSTVEGTPAGGDSQPLANPNNQRWMVGSEVWAIRDTDICQFVQTTELVAGLRAHGTPEDYAATSSKENCNIIFGADENAAVLGTKVNSRIRLTILAQPEGQFIMLRYSTSFDGQRTDAVGYGLLADFTTQRPE